MKTKTYFIILCTLLLFPTLLLGCEQSTGDPFEKEKNDAIEEQIDKSEAAVKKEEVVVKILGISEEDFNRYYKGFADKHPHIKVEAIRDQYMEGNSMINRLGDRQWMEKNKPDILMFNVEEVFYRFVTNEKLTDISLIVPEKDIDAFYPPIMEYIRQLGSGRLYGVPESFTTMGLYYNKDLFDKYKIEYPRDQMNWTEVFQLAKRISEAGKKDGVTGLMSDSSLFHFIASLRKTNHLSTFDTSGKANLHSTEWKELISSVLEGYKNGYIDVFTGNNHFGDFGEGMAAMYTTTGNAVLKSDVGYGFEYGLVTEPVNANQPSRTNHLAMTSIMSINAESEHKQEAWELLYYMISEGKEREINKINLPVLTQDIELLQKSNPKSASLFKLQDIGDVMEDDTFKYQYSFLASNDDFLSYLDDKISFDELLTVLEKHIDENKAMVDAYRASNE